MTFRRTTPERPLLEYTARLMDKGQHYMVASQQLCASARKVKK
jgi:hypothetical protein